MIKNRMKTTTFFISTVIICFMFGCSSSPRIECKSNISFITDNERVFHALSQTDGKDNFPYLNRSNIFIMHEFMKFYENQSGHVLEFWYSRSTGDQPMFVYYGISGFEDLFVVLQILNNDEGTYYYADEVTIGF